jgi:hypothetical protein
MTAKNSKTSHFEQDYLTYLGLQTLLLFYYYDYGPTQLPVIRFPYKDT